VAVNLLDPPVRSLRPVQPPDPSGAPTPSPSLASGAQPDGSAVEDAVNGAFAVLTVTAALVRYVVETSAQSRRAALSRLPMAGYLPGLPHRLAHPASSAVRALSGMADRLVPHVARAVLARLDVPALVRDYVDLDRLAALLDVEAVVARVDLDAAVDRVDIARVLDRVDIDAVVDRADVDRVIARTDIAGLARYVVAVIDLPGLLRASSDSGRRPAAAPARPPQRDGGPHRRARQTGAHR
jgi:hypothetical protein